MNVFRFIDLTMNVFSAINEGLINYSVLNPNISEKLGYCFKLGKRKSLRKLEKRKKNQNANDIQKLLATCTTTGHSVVRRLCVARFPFFLKLF